MFPRTKPDGLLALAPGAVGGAGLEGEDPGQGAHGAAARHDSARHPCLALRPAVERFLDDIPDPKDVPEDLVDVVRQAMPQLIPEWDKMYPENPVSSAGGDDE